MAVSYNRLWHILIDRNMSKTQLIKMAGITTNAMARMGKNEDVRVEVLAKICTALGCTMDEIVEMIREFRKEVYESLSKGRQWRFKYIKRL